MNGTRSGAARRPRSRQTNRVLMVVFVVVLFAGLFGQIAMLARVSAQNREARTVDREIRELNASVDNLTLSLNQYHNLERIAALAQRLGMEQPTEGQIRVVNLPGAIRSTSAQSAEAVGAEEIID